MLCLFASQFPWWFGFSKKTKMVDLQPMNLETWLREASLFCNEPVDYSQSLDFDDLLSNEKANIEGSPVVLSLPDFGWLEENVDLSVLDNPNGLPNHPDETKTLMEDDDAFLLGFLDSGGFNPSYLPSDAFEDQYIELAKCLESQNFITDATSSENLDLHLETPQCSTFQASSPAYSQSPSSPYSDISDAPVEPLPEFILSTPDTSNVSTVPSSSADSSGVYVEALDVCSPVSSTALEEVSSIEEVCKSVRKRKYANDGKDIPKVKVILHEFLPHQTKITKPKDRRERKKAQNKEAAARYRVKKRMEEKVLGDEIAELESHQKKLQEKHDELKSEIKYLKSLMCEILHKKGIMK